MNISRIRLIVVLCFMTFTVLAQKNKADTVMLNDGSVILGTIIADSADYLKMKVKKPRIIILNKSQISTVVRPGREGSTDKHGYFLQLSASFLAGQNSNGSAWNTSIQLLNAYRFRNGLSLGLGTGVEKFDVSLVPVYADLRLHPFKARVSPFIWVSSGYGFVCSDRKDDDNYLYNYFSETRGGMMFNAGAGISIYSWDRCAVSAGIGYRYQRIISEPDNIMGGASESELITDFNRIEILFGILFR